MIKRNDIKKQNCQAKEYKKITSHSPLVLISQNKQSINISLPHVGRHVFFQNMAANDVSKTTHIYSSKSTDQLISAKGNKEFIPSGIHKQVYKKPEHEL